jgi:hypothetical protein
MRCSELHSAFPASSPPSAFDRPSTAAIYLSWSPVSCPSDGVCGLFLWLHMWLVFMAA